MGSYETHIREDGIVELAFIGNMDISDLELSEKDFLLPHLATAAEASKKVNILYYADREGRFSVKARQKLNAINEDSRLERLAVLKGNRVSQVLVTMLLKVSGKDNIKFFDDEVEALRWLNGESK